jgi:hypothetical protein
MFQAFILAALVVGAQAQRPIPPAFGPHVGLSPEAFRGVPSFRSGDKLVLTYYFYWYDAATGLHVVDHDGTDALTDHPPTLEGFSYKSVAWHKKELADMEAAGIDVVLPVFWGAPSEHDPKAHLHWSYEGLPPLVQAREQLLSEGRRPPRIGLFYDTSTLENNAWRERQDLRTERGKAWFYATVRDFFSLIPPRHWAMIEGKPIVFLYSASFASGHDGTLTAFLNESFARDVGGRAPYLVREVSWNIPSDGVYAWGGALGLKNPGVASLGPGYDHTAVPGRDPLVAPREEGRFYERNWHKFLRRPSNLVCVETWNEFHEGTTVCESKEYGRRYIELTRKYADLFRQGWTPPPVRGPYTGASSVSTTLGDASSAKGLRQVDHEDGKTRPAERAGRPARESVKTRFGGRFVYFAVEESFRPERPADFILEVEYFDEAPGFLELEYDGSDPSAPFGGAYTRSPDRVAIVGDGKWKKAAFRLPRAVFSGSQNAGADFRLDVRAEALSVARVVLRRS